MHQYFFHHFILREQRTKMSLICRQERTPQSRQTHDANTENLLLPVSSTPRADFVSEHSHLRRPDSAENRKRIVSPVKRRSQRAPHTQCLFLRHRTAEPAASGLPLAGHVQNADFGLRIAVQDGFGCCEAVAVLNCYSGRVSVEGWGGWRQKVRV